MSDNLLNYGHITHLIKIICMIEVFSASCIRLFDRLSDIGGHVPKSGVSKHFRCLKEVRLFPKI